MKKNLLAGLCAGILLTAVPTSGYASDNATFIKSKAVVYGYLSDQWKTLCDKAELSPAQAKERVLVCSFIAGVVSGGTALLYGYLKLIGAYSA